MKGKNLLIMFGGLISWGAMLLSVAFYLLFWRTDNEPGAKDFPELLWTAIGLVSIGGLGLVGSNLYLLIKKAWAEFFIGCGLYVALLIGAISLSPILLLFLV